MSLNIDIAAGLGGSGDPGGALAGGGVYSYNIDQSLRFNNDDTAYLSRTPTTAGNRDTWTISMWVKRSGLGLTQSKLFAAGSSFPSNHNNSFYMWFQSDDTLRIFNESGGAYYTRLDTTKVFRDIAGWYHIVYVYDSTQTLATDRQKLYINGVQETAFDLRTDPGLNVDSQVNATHQHLIGASTITNTFDGYMAEVHFVDGTALDADDFGEINGGVWVPKEVSGLTYGTNGFYLPFSNSNDIGLDKSGNQTLVTSTSFSTIGGGTTNFTQANADKGFDHDLSTNCDRTGTSGIIEITPTSAITPVSHTMINANSAAYTAPSRPNSVKLQGSNDGGSTWTDIDTLTNGSGANVATTSSFANTTSYAKLRLNIVSNHGGSNTRFSEYRVFSSEDDGDGENIFLATNLDTSDVVPDSPTINYPTFNTLVRTGQTLTHSEGNLEVASSSFWSSSVWSRMTMAGHGGGTGKFYAEFVNYGSSGGGATVVGVGNYESLAIDTTKHNDAIIYYYDYIEANGSRINIGGNYASPPGISGNEVVRMAWDCSNGKVWIGASQEWFDVGSGVGDPANDSNPSGTISNFSGSPIGVLHNRSTNTGQCIMNFGQNGTFNGTLTAGGYSDENGYGNFYYPVPSGFVALNSANLPEPAIGPGQSEQADDYFETILYTGNGATQHIGSGGAQHPIDVVAIGNSCRFNSSDSVYFSNSSRPAGDRQQFTISFWFKQGKLGVQRQFFEGASNANGFFASFTSANQLYLFDLNAASGGFQIYGGPTFNDTSRWHNMVIAVDTPQSTNSDRIKVWVDNEQIDLSTFTIGAGASAWPDQNSSFNWNSGANTTIGFGNSSYWDGYLAEFVNIDGSVLDPTSFGQYGSNGYWIPKDVSGLTFGDEGFYLKFSDNSTANALGTDSTSNSNDFTPTANLATTDQMGDSPTQNFNTFDPNNSYSSGSRLSDGNLKYTHDGANGHHATTLAFNSSGNWYWEVDLTNSASAWMGVVDANQSCTGAGSINGYFWYPQNGYRSENPYGTSDAWIGTTATAGDIIGFQIENEVMTIYKNGVSLGSPFTVTPGYYRPFVMSPGAGTGISTFNFGADDTFAGSQTSGSAAASDANGYGSFYYTPPTDALAIVDDNIPVEGIVAPDLVWIKNRSTASTDHYLVDSVRGDYKQLASNSTAVESTNTNNGTKLEYNGFTIGALGDTNTSGNSYVSWNWKAGGPSPTQTYTVKVVSDSGNKYRFDDFGTSAVTLSLQEGGTYTFDQSDSSNATHPLRFSTTSDGTHNSGSEYTVGVTTSGTPGSAGAKTVITVAAGAPTLYYYCSTHSGMGGQANTTETHGSTNLKGSTQSVVSANQDAGFSIVSYTGTGVGADTVGHGLTQKPDMVICKARTSAGVNYWHVNHKDLTASDYNMFLNLGSAETDVNTNYSEGGIGLGDANVIDFVAGYSGANNVANCNNSGTDYIAYCFHSVEGFSKVGVYTGNGNADGTFVYLGFRPRWLMFKDVSNTNIEWNIYYDEASPFNVMNDYVAAASSAAESTNVSTRNLDFLSNGFKLRDAYAQNYSSYYVYIAFAQAPFKYANARC